MDTVIETKTKKINNWLHFSFLLFFVSILIKTINDVFYIKNTTIINMIDYLKIGFFIPIIIIGIAGFLNILINVNFLYFLVSLSSGLSEKEENQKKMIKNLLYISFLVPLTLNNILLCLIEITVKQSISLSFINLSSLFIYLMVSIFVYFIIKRTVERTKINRYIPLAIYIFNTFNAILYFSKLFTTGVIRL